MGKYKAYQLNMIDRYHEAPKFRHLCDCYKTVSREKEIAYAECIKKMRADRGSMWTIVTYNKHMFTFAYICNHYGVDMLVYITPYKTHRIELYNPFR